MSKILFSILLSGGLVFFAHAELHSIGLGTVVYKSPYKDVSTKVVPAPMINYSDDNFYFYGVKGGYYVYKDQNQRVTADIMYAPLTYKPSDSNDPNMKKLTKRNPTVMAGASYFYMADWGNVGVNLAADMLNKSKSIIVDTSYNYVFDMNRWQIVPEIGVMWANNKHNNYYYGISKQESATSGLPQYNTNGTTISPYIQLVGNYSMSKHWSAIAGARFDFLDSDIKDSPMISKSDFSLYTLGVNYQF